MEKKFHISPKTTRPERCRAQFKRCKFGEHYGSEREAQSTLEAEALAAAGSALPTAQSKAPRRPSVPLEEIRVADEKKSSYYHYQELWVRDSEGTPAVYAKVNLMSHGPEGKRPGVVLCDLEINPAVRGQGHALEFLRKLKAEHGAESIELTGMLSEDGYKMYLRMQEHEARTGEKILSIQHGERLIVPREGTSYSFVHDWEQEQGKYPL